MTKVLVVGANGATGILLVKTLLQKNIGVIAIVRNSESLKHLAKQHDKLQIVEADVTKMTKADFGQYVSKCSSVLSCLGHNLTIKGVFGKPRRLVTDTIKKIVESIDPVDPVNSGSVTKIILMNTAGNSNRDIHEKPPLSQRVVTLLLRLLLPPHVDNEKASDYLREQTKDSVEWAVVRPDGLKNKKRSTAYEVFPSPTRNAIFNPGSTSRINVANFMSKLAIDNDLWQKWKSQMPVIYDKVLP